MNRDNENLVRMTPAERNVSDALLSSLNLDVTAPASEETAAHVDGRCACGRYTIPDGIPDDAQALHALTVQTLLGGVRPTEVAVRAVTDASLHTKHACVIPDAQPESEDDNVVGFVYRNGAEREHSDDLEADGTAAIGDLRHYLIRIERG